MRRLSFVLTLVLVATVLAGCAEQPGGGDGTNTTTPPPGGEGADCASTTDATKRAAEPTWVMETTMGTIRITLFCDKTPETTQHLVKLTEAGCYDGTRFHRVITGFMDQGGDPLSKDDAQRARWGRGGPSDCGQEPDTIVDEFSCADGSLSTTHPATCSSGLGLLHDTPGTLSMANTGQAHTGGSQFFIIAEPTPWLDGKHAVFGHTADEESLNVVLAINNAGSESGTPQTLVTITRATIDWS